MSFFLYGSRLWLKFQTAFLCPICSAEPSMRSRPAKCGSALNSRLSCRVCSTRFALCIFETVYPALPRFAGMRPYDHLPFQWSVHRQEQPGAALEHFEFLAEGHSDPRRLFLESLIQALRGAGDIVVYNQAFESLRLDDLAQWLPEYQSEIAEIRPKLWDLFAVSPRNLYHPAVRASFPLREVVPT